MNKEKSTPIQGRLWVVFVVFGLIGQLAWTIENMYLNVFLYKTVTFDPDAIAWMVALSAIVATIATFFMGALSDRVGKRKRFMTIGYMVWGLSISAFGFITKANVARVFPAFDVVAMTILFIILLDCLMTFIGSTANDAAFQSWVTDVTTPTNRGKAEGVLATMPLLGMLVVFGVFDSLTKQGQWQLFFSIIGIIVFIAGFLGLFFIKDNVAKREKTRYLHDLLIGFQWQTLKNNRLLYGIFATVMLLGIAQQVFLPYFIIYFEFYLGIQDYALILGSILLFASIISIIGGRVVDRVGKAKPMIPMAFLYVFGMFILFVLGKLQPMNGTINAVLTILFGVLMMGSYLVLMVILNAMSRDKIPTTHIGVFSGVRMIFFVMVPMIIGPFLGSSVIKNSSSTYMDEFGVIQSTPIPEIFLAGSIVALLAIIPIWAIYIVTSQKKREERL